MEHQITFNDQFIPLLLSGHKTQTRRLIKPQPSSAWMRGDGTMGWNDENGFPQKNTPCFYGKPGDLLWVREFWDERHFPETHFAYRANDPKGESILSAIYEWKDPITMPRRASRITLKIEEVRVERVQEITEYDAIAEGFVSDWDNTGYSAANRFAEIWDDIYPDNNFDSNPYCWVIVFSLCV